MRLESSDSFWLTGLTNGVDSISNTDLSLDWLELLVESDEHARVDGKRQIEQEVMVFACDEGLHVCCGDQHGEQATKGYVREQELL